MARLPRLYLPGVPQHVIQRGNNRQVCFNNEQDLSAYAHWLHEAAGKFDVSLHAWVFMTNHVHLLVSSDAETAVPNTMQYLGRLYVRYYNREYRRSGTLWEGRYKSCLIQDKYYLLQCSRYIELNPVRAGMVNDPGDYQWSSYNCNAFGKQSKLYTAHAEYLALGATVADRQKAYRDLFSDYIEDDVIHDIRQSVNQGLVLGDGRFKDQVEQNLARRARPGKPGRPRNRETAKVVDDDQMKMLI